jgi:hypothetical protein
VISRRGVEDAMETAASVITTYIPVGATTKARTCI